MHYLVYIRYLWSLPYRTQQFTGRGDDKSAYNVLYRWWCIGWYCNKAILFWNSTVMIFVRKLVLACLINSITYIFISYSAHIWIKKCFRESFISDTFLRWNSSHRPTFIHHQQSFRTIIYIISIHVSQFNLSSLLITLCTTNVLFLQTSLAAGCWTDTGVSFTF
jgi:hypothetical protein